MNTSAYIKSLLKLNEITITQMAVLMSEKTGKKYTFPSLSSKLQRNSISFAEVFVIAEILGYEVKFEKIK